MEKVFDQGVVNMLPLTKGIVVSFCDEKTGVINGYKVVAFEDGRVSNITQEVFLAQKFGSNYESIIKKCDNPVTCFAANLSNGELIVLSKNGDAILFDTDARIKWQGNLCFKKAKPTGLTVVGRKIWVAYSDANAIIRYNAVTMKSELRIGGGDNPAFFAPQGMWLANNRMTICCAGNKQLCRIDLDSFELEEYATFDEPIHQYFNIGGYELVRLDSGIYLM